MTKITIIRLLLSFYIPFILFIMVMIYWQSDTLRYSMEYEMVHRMSIIYSIGILTTLPAITTAWLATHYFLKHGYFNPKSRKMLKITGYIFIGISCLTFVLNMVMGYIPGYFKWDLLPNMISGELLQFLLGFGLLVVADFIKQGESIEQENQLTI